ncbi:MAG: aspartyl protease family protein, partial [Pseudomonadota bacterium]
GLLLLSIALPVKAEPAPITGIVQGPIAEPQPIAPSIADPATEILDLERERNQRLTVPVMIEGSGPFDFMIDTGSQATAVTHQINQSLALTPFGTATLVGMASIRPVDVVEVNQLTVGSHVIEDLIAPVLNREHVGADGIIGLDSLQDFRVLIDFREKSIALEDVSEKDNYRRGFEIIVRARQKLGQLLITDALVEGVRATVIIDTGAQASLANNVLRDRIRAKREQEVTTTDVNGVSMIGQMSVVRSLSIEGLSLRNVPLAFADAPAFEALGLKDKPVLSLGMQHLKMFDRVAIDFSRQRILFDVPRDVARAMRRERQSRLRGVRSSF